MSTTVYRNCFVCANKVEHDELKNSSNWDNPFLLCEILDVARINITWDLFDVVCYCTTCLDGFTNIQKLLEEVEILRTKIEKSKHIVELKFKESNKIDKCETPRGKCIADLRNAIIKQLNWQNTLWMTEKIITQEFGFAKELGLIDPVRIMKNISISRLNIEKKKNTLNQPRKDSINTNNISKISPLLPGIKISKIHCQSVPKEQILNWNHQPGYVQENTSEPLELFSNAGTPSAAVVDEIEAIESDILVDEIEAIESDIFEEKMLPEDFYLHEDVDNDIYEVTSNTNVDQLSSHYNLPRRRRKKLYSSFTPHQYPKPSTHFSKEFGDTNSLLTENSKIPNEIPDRRIFYFSKKKRIIVDNQYSKFYKPLSSPFTKCKECGKIFRLLKNLRVHMSQMHSRKKFHCKMCNFGLDSLMSLAEHEKIIHNNSPHS